MRTTTLACLLAAASLAAGCGSRADDIDSNAPKLYGADCKADADCESKICARGTCSRTCTKMTECPPVRASLNPSARAGRLGGKCLSGNECNDGLACIQGVCMKYMLCGDAGHAKGLTCYRRAYPVRKYQTAHDCSAASDRPGVCAGGFKCMGQADALDRFCSPICKSDLDCPPTMRCATITSNFGASQEKRCMRRQFCHPCQLDDQCGGKGAICVKKKASDKTGYCGKACSPSKPGTCAKWAKCEKVAGGKYQCQHKAGSCQVMGGGMCKPCLFHGLDANNKQITEAGTCAKNAVCFRLSGYTNETVCSKKCRSAADCGGANLGCTRSGYCVPIKRVGAGATIGTCFP